MQPNMEKYHLSSEEVYALLDRTKEGVLSTIGKDGYPYGTPVNYIRINDMIYIHGRKTGEKVDNITACNKVCLTVMELGGFEKTGPIGCNTTTVYESAIVRGTAVPVEDEKKKFEILKATVARLTPERAGDEINEKMVGPAAIYEISIESATGKYHRPMPGNKIIH